MDDKVKEINVGKELFTENNVRYVVPLYQRAFAWQDKEISQLVEDINDIDENTQNYYLGTLVVSRGQDYLEVIDGQQRLTALYLLFKVVGIPAKEMITFACREKSTFTLRHIIDENLDKAKCEKSILIGKQILEDEIKRKQNADEDFINKFKAKLNKVKLYRIEVPEKTDLNRYFEIMNTRGEQLELQDILKAYLMSGIVKDKDRQIFSNIWNACSNMNGYIQMHFGQKYREALFGDKWEDIPSVNNLNMEKIEETRKESNTIEQIIKLNQKNINLNNEIEVEEDNLRFESIIDFPYFLLHALRIFVKQKEIKAKNENNVLLAKLLDDKKLVADFKNVITNGTYNGKNIDKNAFAMEFIEFFLKLRFLFDKYIIKREFVNDDKNGGWSLEELKVSTYRRRKSAYFINTVFNDNSNYYKRILMLQSCLRVSYISPKVMHWITELLNWLYKESKHNSLLDRAFEYKEFIEEIAKDACIDFLAREKYNLGVDTPHIIFNYLDYLIWEQEGCKDNFVFEFRNSVEHWYPQNPSKELLKEWKHEEGLDNFGNLCLVQRDMNSELSNLPPSIKKLKCNKEIQKGSLKLRKMANQTTETDGMNADEYWRKEAYLTHEKEMINLLRTACN